MYDTNQVIIIGRLTRDPESSFTQSQKQIAKFSIAVQEGKDKASFFNVTAWEKTAQTICQYMKKGNQVAILGKLKQDRWQDDQGKNRSAVSITAMSVQFIGGKSENPTNQAPQQQMTGQQQPPVHDFDFDLSGAGDDGQAF